MHQEMKKSETDAKKQKAAASSSSLLSTGTHRYRGLLRFLPGGKV
jgi:hypothetical protein